MVAAEDATEAVSQADSESEDHGDSRFGDGRTLSAGGRGSGGVVSVTGEAEADSSES